MGLLHNAVYSMYRHMREREGSGEMYICSRASMKRSPDPCLFPCVGIRLDLCWLSQYSPLEIALSTIFLLPLTYIIVGHVSDIWLVHSYCMSSVTVLVRLLHPYISAGWRASLGCPLCWFNGG